MDYQGNSKKAKAESEKNVKPPPPAEKNLEKVIVGDAIVQKKSLGRKAKDLVVDADFKGAAREAIRHMFSDVLVPSAKSTAWDMWTDFGRHTIFRGAGTGPRSFFDPKTLVQRMTYNSPVQRSTVAAPRDPREPRSSIAPPIEMRHQTRSDIERVIVGSKEEAELILIKMSDVIEAYDVVSVHDLKELLGHPKSPVDVKWGWVSVADAPIRQSPQGWVIEFPSPQPIYTS